MVFGLIWPDTSLEPLMVGIRFPLSRTYPFELKLDRDRVATLGRTLSEVSKTCHVRLGDHLRELWLSQK